MHDERKGCVVNPVRYRHEPVITESCLLFVNPGEEKFVAEEARQARAKRHFLFNSNLYELAGDTTSFWAGPALGAAMAAMTLEKLIALGARKVVLFGCCGAIHECLHTGDLFLPTWGKSEEGVSQHYPVAGDEIATSGPLRAELKSFVADRGFHGTEGPIWTTDAPFRETRSKVMAYRQEGILAVDMELTALARVACFRGIDLAAIMLVSDELYHPAWKPGFGNKALKAKTKMVFRELAKLLQSQVTAHPKVAKCP